MHTTTSGELPGNHFAGAQRHERLAAEGDGFRHGPVLAHERDAAAVRRQVVEPGAVHRGEAFEPVEGLRLLEGDGVELDRSMRGVDAGAAAAGFLRRARMRRTAGAEEKLPVTRGRSL